MAVALCQLLIIALQERSIEMLLVVTDVTRMPCTATPTTCASDAASSCLLTLQSNVSDGRVMHGHADEGLKSTETLTAGSEVHA